MIDESDNSFGFMLKLKNENCSYKRMSFCSSDCNSPLLRPKLEIYYNGPSKINVTDVSEKNADYTVFPNPCKGKFSIKSNSFQNNVKIQIFNFSGQKVKELISENNHLEIDISDLPKGLYFINLNSKETFFSSKVIVE